MKRSMVILSFVVILFPCLSLADVPGLISFQGILKDSEDQPVDDGVYAFKFKIVNDEDQVLWESSGYVPIQTTEALFTHILGSTNSIPDSLSRYDSLWVDVTVAPDEVPTFTTMLVSVPYALSSQYADTTGTSLDKTIDASELTEGTLDVERFSAYDDLLAEDRIGQGTGQVAQGNHTHPTAGYLVYITSDTVVVTATGEVWATRRSFVIPGGSVSNGIIAVYNNRTVREVGYVCADINQLITLYGYIRITANGITKGTSFSNAYDRNGYYSTPNYQLWQLAGLTNIQFLEITDVDWNIDQTINLDIMAPDPTGYCNPLCVNDSWLILGF